MGIASLVLGIISLVLGWIPFVCFFVFILAVIGLVLGIVDTIKKNKTEDKKRGISIAGLIISAISIPVIIIMSFISIGIVATAIEGIDNTNRNHYYDYDNDYDDWYEEWYDSFYNKLENNKSL